MSTRVARAWGWTALIVVLCWLPAGVFFGGGAGPETGRIPHKDKLAHLSGFAVFGWLWTRAASPARRAGLVLAGGLALAIITEAGQALPAVGRDADPFDALADLAGTGLGLLGEWSSRGKT